MMIFTGILKVKKNTEQISDKFKKREIVICDNSSQYPQTVLFQLTQDRCALVDNIEIGQEITVHFNLMGREWTNPQGQIKYFNTLNVFKIEVIGNAQESNDSTFTNETLIPTPDDALPF